MGGTQDCRLVGHSVGQAAVELQPQHCQRAPGLGVSCAPSGSAQGTRPLREENRQSNQPLLAQTQVLGPCVWAGLSSWLEDQPRGRLGPGLRNQTPLFLPTPRHSRLQDQERQQAGLNTCSACQPPPAMLLVWSPPASSHLYGLHLHHLHLYGPTCIIPTCMVPTCSIPTQVPTIPIIFTAVGNWAAPPLLRGS